MKSLAAIEQDESPSRFRFLLEHSLLGKPVSTFPDHALLASALGAVHSMWPMSDPRRVSKYRRLQILGRQTVTDRDTKQVDDLFGMGPDVGKLEPRVLHHLDQLDPIGRRTGGEARIPEPAQSLAVIAYFERDAVEDGSCSAADRLGVRLTGGNAIKQPEAEGDPMINAEPSWS